MVDYSQLEDNAGMGDILACYGYMGFPRQKYWCGLPFPAPGDLPNPGIEPVSTTLAGRFFTPASPGSSFLWYSASDPFWKR